MPNIPARLPRRRLQPAFYALWLMALLGLVPALNLGAAPAPQDVEPNSPDEKLPGLAEPNLSPRAVPIPNPPPPAADLDFQKFYRRLDPYGDPLDLTPALAPYSPMDPSAFRPVTIYAPPLGLRPQLYHYGLFDLYPWFGIAQSFDSNVQLTPHNQISDFYATPHFGLEAQLGTPDSIYNEGYDTILATHLSYEGYADLFYEHPDLSAYNQRFDFSTRIGRDRFILRPFANVSDITGNNLGITELQNRVRRIITTGGIIGEYGFTPVTAWRQTYSGFNFQHTDPLFINYTTWSTRQELTYLLPNNTKAILWGGAQTTSPDRGFSGNEYFIGAGWQGQFNSQFYSDLWLGWGELQQNGNVPGRENLSGIRYNGRTILDYSPRVRLTLLYDRAYAYNELDKNDNYVSTLTQLKAEFFLGNHFYITPYFGCSFDQFETSRRLDMELRPETEFSYVFARENFKIISTQDKLAGSRVFVKLGYGYITTLKGSGDPVQDFRISTGINWNY